MPIRTGEQFIAGLRAHPRDVWVKGQRVADVTRHPAFAGSIAQLARLYDMQHAPATQDALTYVVPETGERAGLAFMPTKTVEDLRRKRKSYRIWAESNFGLMGRSPDFMNVTLLAFAEAKDRFAPKKVGCGGRPAVRRQHRALLQVRPRQRPVPEPRADRAAKRSLQAILGTGQPASARREERPMPASS